MIDEQGVIMFLVFIVIVLTFVLVGTGIEPIKHEKKAGKVVEFIGHDGKVHKAQLLPDEKQKKKSGGWKYSE